MSRIALSCLFFAALTTFTMAADGDVPAPENVGKASAFTSPPVDDLNYSLLGEFVGEMKAAESEESAQPEVMGLQIRPIGGDNFDALSFKGGLPGQEKPGQEKFGAQPMRLIGRRSGDVVVLSGGPWAMFVSADACVLVDREGNKLGKLDRVTRTSPTMSAPPPDGSVVLFDGSGTDQLVNANVTDDGLLMQGADVRPMFQDFNLHVEFRLPYMPSASDQARANSGLYLLSRYECQVLDSFALDPVFNGCGSIYRFKQPDVNMCLPPLVWQTYDIVFTAPRWAGDGSKIRDAHITSWINGVKVQDDVAVPSQTGHGKEEAPTLLPIKLQDHGDPVRFRNVWAIDRGLTMVNFPIEPTAEEIQAWEKKKADEVEKVVPEPSDEEPAAESTDEKPEEPTPPAN